MTQRIQLKISDGEYDAIQALSNESGIKLSVLLRQWIEEKLKELRQDHEESINKDT